MKKIKGIPVKKKYGQHFLRNQSVVDHMVDAVKLDNSSSIMEIGCGEGILTRRILQEPIARLWVFEIDPEWAHYVRTSIDDTRLTIYEQNVLDIDPAMLKLHEPWILLGNLPYQVTFPILHLIARNRFLFSEGVVMIQEEVAQKILKTRGKGYGYPSLFFQYYFDWKKMEKIPPGNFYPPPKVFSRLLYFKPKKEAASIPNEEKFWKFIKICFKQPRRTLKNNLAQSHFNLEKISEDYLSLRAQQLSMTDFLALWNLLRRTN